MLMPLPLWQSLVSRATETDVTFITGIPVRLLGRIFVVFSYVYQSFLIVPFPYFSKGSITYLLMTLLVNCIYMDCLHVVH